MKTIFSTIQFIDSHSESIRHKNLMVVNNKPLWMYNAEAAKALCRPLLIGDTSIPGGEKFWLKDNWICTTYNDSIIPPDFGQKIPRYAINTGKCKLGDRVAGAVNFLNGNVQTAADAYVILLGNVVSSDPKALILRACESWCAMKYMTPELTGLLSVTNYPMFGPGRALTTEHGLFAKNASPIDKRFGEEKQDEVASSWFFDGGVMIMDAKNKLIGHTAIVTSDMRSRQLRVRPQAEPLGFRRSVRCLANLPSAGHQSNGSERRSATPHRQNRGRTVRRCRYMT